MTQETNEMSAPMLGSLVSWKQRDSQWFVAWRYGKPVSAFRFETDEVHRSRSSRDQQRPLWMWSAVVPGDDGSRMLSWPDGTAIAQMKADLIAADCRLH